jgi:nicotinamidase-related amidase
MTPNQPASSLEPPSSLWNHLLTDEDRALVSRARFGRRSGLGSRPAVVVIDAQNYMVGPIGDEPYAYPSSCGEAGKAALAVTARLLDAARAAGAPVFYTQWQLARDGSDMGTYRLKRDLVESEGWALEGSFGAQIAEAVAPQPGDTVFVKKKPSGFHGTPLTGLLIDRKVDGVIIVGGSTSNCVRATAVDAMSINLRVTIPADAVFDRFALSHRTALFDLDRQYGDVRWADDVIAELQGGGERA